MIYMLYEDNLRNQEINFVNCYRYLRKLKSVYNFFFKGEDLRKQIGAAAYIECSSKTQEVFLLNQLLVTDNNFILFRFYKLSYGFRHCIHS
jgi:hypothetical protein